MATATLRPAEPPVPTGAILFAPPKRGGAQLQRASTAFPGCGHAVWSLSGGPAPLPHRVAAQAKLGPTVLLRTCSAPTSAVVCPVPGGGGCRAAGAATAAAAAAPPSGAAAAAGVEGLEEFLRSRGLEAHAPAAEAWCSETGAAFLEEVLENRGELASALGLVGAERERLLGEAPEAAEAGGEEHAEAHVSPATLQPARPIKVLASPSPAGILRGTTVVSSPVVWQPAGGMARTTTTPVTTQETASAEVRASKAYVPLRAWQHIVVAPAAAAPAAAAHGGALLRSLSEDAQVKAERQLLGPDWDPLSHRQWKREAPGFYHMRDWTPPRYRITDGRTLHALRTRIPSPAELNALSEAQQRLSQAHATAPESKAAQVKPLRGESLSDLQDLRQSFLAEYGQRIRSELPGATLEPAGIAGHVSQRFLNACDNDTTIQAAYHGTKQSNYNAIFQKGLVVPGTHGVQVAHGSAHGVGVYTATLGNSWLSKGFADSDSFLVCAVADNNTDGRRRCQQPQAVAKPSVQPPRVSGVRNVRFHKSHHKPAQALGGGGGQWRMGNQVVHSETPDVRHVGNAMVVFDSARVAPLFVATGIGKPGANPQGPYTNRAALWPAAGSPNMQNKGKLPGGGLHSGSRQANVGGEKLWLQPQEERYKQAIHLRRRITAKARDVDRRAHRDAKDQVADP